MIFNEAKKALKGLPGDGGAKEKMVTEGEMTATNQCHATRPEIDRIAITEGISYHCQKILELHS